MCSCARGRRLIAATAVAVLGACSGGEPAAVDRAALIVLARDADPALDEVRAGCVADGLTAAMGADQAAVVLRARPPATLSPPDTERVTRVGAACSGAPGLAVPPGSTPS